MNQPNYKAIETTWKGYRFRSRTEARWAVFLEALGVRFEYEPEGVILPSGPYLPDFRLTLYDVSPESEPEPRRVWLEIKGSDPTRAELEKCSNLAAATGDRVLLAVGAPDPRPGVYFVYPSDGADPSGAERREKLTRAEPWAFAECSDRGGVALSAPFRWQSGPDAADGLLPFGGQLWLGNLSRETECVRPRDEWRSVFGPRTRAAYDAARAARFEFGQTDKRWGDDA